MQVLQSCCSLQQPVLRCFSLGMLVGVAAVSVHTTQKRKEMKRKMMGWRDAACSGSRLREIHVTRIPGAKDV